jgi:hypothetical protein
MFSTSEVIRENTDAARAIMELFQSCNASDFKALRDFIRGVRMSGFESGFEVGSQRRKETLK